MLSSSQRFLGACLLLSTICCLRAQADWTDASNINKWFDNQKDKHYNIQTPGKVENNTGPLQKPGAVQQSGSIEKAGALQIPRGIKAISQSQSTCQHRYIIGADALFDFDKSELNGRARETLDALGPLLLRESSHPIRIEGHTDGIGTAEYNQKLSERRSDSVDKWLIENHFLTSVATTCGYGKTRPVAPNKNPDGSDNPMGRQKNRRVEIIVDTCATAQQIKNDKNLVWVDDMDLGYVTQGQGESHKGKSNAGNPITLSGKVYKRGLGTHSPSELSIDLKGVGKRFESIIGIDDEVGAGGSASFEVWVDNGKVFDSGVMRGGDTPLKVDIDLTGARGMVLIVSDGNDGFAADNADWADARISVVDGTASNPEAMSVQNIPPIVMASSDAKREAAIHGAKIVGASPNKPFLFLIPATGSGQLRYSATNLPQGLHLDGATGIISGAIKNLGSTDVALTVENTPGTAQSTLTIVCGKDQLGATPPMGWNSWNVWAATVDQEKVKAAADWLVRSGLSSHGYQYINIDDGWEGGRDAAGHILPNNKFPNMKGLADYVHSKGLKLGIYSSPGPKTCQGLEGSYNHEADDAATFAKWGVDYLKYDLCSYTKLLTTKDEADLKKPYDIMGKALASVDRDIFYSLCEYGMADVWKWGASVRGNSWRTTGDIADAWGTVCRQGFGENAHAKYAGPGHWNDPDMLVVGKVGMGWGAKLHGTRLTQNEQITHFTLWSLVCAPLLIGCDMSSMDKFTLNLLSNDEVIAVNQDKLGKPATRLSQHGLVEVWSRPLSDGTIAVGFFNRSIQQQPIRVGWSDLGLSAPQTVRDLWEQSDRGSYPDSFQIDVPAHGARLFKIIPQ